MLNGQAGVGGLPFFPVPLATLILRRISIVRGYWSQSAVIVGRVVPRRTSLESYPPSQVRARAALNTRVLAITT